MTRFGPDPKEFFEGVYTDIPPWDIGGPQPPMVDLLREFPPSAPILDVGCGSGDLAIHLAERGFAVLGIDFVSLAIDHAREKALDLPTEVEDRLEFRVADALRPTALEREFGSVVDSGFLHLLTPEQAEGFVQEVGAVLRPGGRFYLHEFATEFPIPNSPRAITREEVRARFSPERGWSIRTLRSAEFLSRIAPVPAILACVERLSSSQAPSG